MGANVVVRARGIAVRGSRFAKERNRVARGEGGNGSKRCRGVGVVGNRACGIARIP